MPEDLRIGLIDATLGNFKQLAGALDIPKRDDLINLQQTLRQRYPEHITDISGAPRQVQYDHLLRFEALVWLMQHPSDSGIQQRVREAFLRLRNAGFHDAVSHAIRDPHLDFSREDGEDALHNPIINFVAFIQKRYPNLLTPFLLQREQEFAQQAVAQAASNHRSVEDEEANIYEALGFRKLTPSQLPEGYFSNILQTAHEETLNGRRPVSPNGKSSALDGPVLVLRGIEHILEHDLLPRIGNFGMGDSLISMPKATWNLLLSVMQQVAQPGQTDGEFSEAALELLACFA